MFSFAQQCSNCALKDSWRLMPTRLATLPLQNYTWTTFHILEFKKTSIKCVFYMCDQDVWAHSSIQEYFNVTEHYDLRKAWIITEVLPCHSAPIPLLLGLNPGLCGQLYTPLYRTCLLAWASALGLPLSNGNTGWRRVIWRATRSFIIEWSACLSSEEDNGLEKMHS